MGWRRATPASAKRNEPFREGRSAFCDDQELELRYGNTGYESGVYGYELKWSPARTYM